MKLAPLLLAFVSLAADAGVFATAVAPNGRQVVLYDEECPKADPQTHKVDLLTPEGGRLFSGCWHATSGIMVEILWEDSDTSTIPINMFKIWSGRKQVPQS